MFHSNSLPCHVVPGVTSSVVGPDRDMAGAAPDEAPKRAKKADDDDDLNVDLSTPLRECLFLSICAFSLPVGAPFF